MSDINNQLNRILQSNLSQQISTSLQANQMEIKHLQDTLLAKNQQVHVLNKKLKQQLQFINTVIKKNSVLERRIAQLCLYTGKLIKQVNEQRKIEKEIIEQEIRKMKAFTFETVNNCFSQINQKMLQIISQKEIQKQICLTQRGEKLSKSTNTEKNNLIQLAIQTEFSSTLQQLASKQIQTVTLDTQSKKLAQQNHLMKQQNQKVLKKLRQAQEMVEHLQEQKKNLQSDIMYYKNICSLQENPISLYIEDKREHVLTLVEEMYDNQFELEQDRYHGQTIRGMKFGRGVCHYANGVVYDGYFVNGQRQGMGILKIEDQQIYRGYWKNNKFEGKGILKILKKWKQCNFCGLFLNGRQTGAGTLNFPNKFKIKAKWQGQTILGKSILTLPNGISYSGKFSDNNSFKKQDGQIISIDI